MRLRAEILVKSSAAYQSRVVELVFLSYAVTSLRVAMPRSYCFLCASDEGVFLEFTPETARLAFAGQIETCLSKKVIGSINLSNKICYKCTYELDQCSKFLQKSKKSLDAKKFPKIKASVPHCSLCCEAVENGHIFDITEDNRSIFSPLQKIRKIFNEDLYKKVSSFKLVCLVCRYNLDVLYDLKKLHEETVNNLESLINKKLDYTNYPKVYTNVVNRKTTITTFPDTTVYGLISSSDSENNDEMAREKSRGKLRGKPRSKPHSKISVNKSNTIEPQNNVKTKSRSCDQCNNIVGNGMDMYRLYHTGQTVCRNCWITTDPNKSKSRRNSYSSLAETKLCTVYLKDVLNEGSHNDDNVYKVEEVKDDDEMDIVSDQSSQNRDKNLELLRQRKRKQTVNGNTRQNKKRRINSTTKSDVESTSKETRVSAIIQTRSKKALSDLDQPSTNFQNQEKSKRKISYDLSSDSDHSQQTSIAKNRTKRNEKRANYSIQSLSSTSEDDDTNKIIDKKQKSVDTEVASNVRSESNDESPNETSGKISRRHKSRAKVSVMSTRTRTRSSSISSKEMTPPVEFKSPRVVSPQEYACDKCNKKFSTKLAQAEHKLTHVKQLTLRLEKLSILHEEKEEELKEDLQKDKTASEEMEADTSETAIADKNSTDLSEEIALNIDDDTDDDIFLSKHKKKDDQKGKPDTKKSESDQEDESLKIQVNEEANESQQCTDPIIVDEIATEENDTNEDIILTNEVNASKDQADHAQEKKADIVESHKMSDNEKEDEDTTKEDDTEKTSAAKKEEKHNKDVDVDDRITLDNEKTEFSVLSAMKNNKDNIVEHDEDNEKSFESNLENNHKDNENEKAKDAEAKLSENLTNDFQEEDPKESVEKRFTPDVNEIETLSDKENSMIEYPKNARDATDEQDVDEIEGIIDADKYDDSTDSIIKPNLLNCEILDELEDKRAEEMGDDVAVDVIDNNDTTVKSKKVTEETVITSDSLTEELTTIEDVNDIEQLIENNVEDELQDKKHKECKNSHNTSTNTATKIMEEVFDLAAAEVQKRRNSNGIKMNSDEDIEMETLENISREIHNSADMPSLDMESTSIAMSDVNDIVTLN